MIRVHGRQLIRSCRREYLLQRVIILKLGIQISFQLRPVRRNSHGVRSSRSQLLLLLLRLLPDSMAARTDSMNFLMNATRSLFAGSWFIWVYHLYGVVYHGRGERAIWSWRERGWYCVKTILGASRCFAVSVPQEISDPRKLGNISRRQRLAVSSWKTRETVAIASKEIRSFWLLERRGRWNWNAWSFFISRHCPGLLYISVNVSRSTVTWMIKLPLSAFPSFPLRFLFFFFVVLSFACVAIKFVGRTN